MQKNSDSVARELKIHLVYAGDHYIYHEAKLRSFIWNGMKNNKIKSVMVTKICMTRENLITKERMESICRGEEKELKDSVNDDLESLFEDIRLGKQLDEWTETYFLPKLTEEELELVEQEKKNGNDFSFKGLLQFNRSNPDVPETEMMLSQSDSKYIRGSSFRETFVIEKSFINVLKYTFSLNDIYMKYNI